MATEPATVEHEGFTITVTQDNGRFTPRITRAGHMIAHDGRVSEAWSGASCGSLQRAVDVARNAIDNDKVR